ncbi:MAG: hypothetical protein HY892_11905 [Deltaproteobacteria bacterium]|nr:hypothetical protein [Deltaproteobacteria bacterium]
MQQVQLDLNSPVFQRQWFNLQKRDQGQVLGILRKLLDMDWDQVYKDRGLKWELVLSQSGPEGKRLYSLRLGAGFRALACREGNWLRLLSLHPDHDSAYEGR